MRSEKELVGAIVVIMRGCWEFLPELKVGELEGYAAELLRKFRRIESNDALEQFVATKQHALGVVSPTAFKEIVARCRKLVKNSN